MRVGRWMTLSAVAAGLVKDGFWKVSRICTPRYAAACHAAGIE
jgi:hypothetical protein